MLGWSVAAVAVPFVPGSYAGRAGAAAIKGTKALEKAEPLKKVPKVHSKPPAPKPKPPVKKPPTQKAPRKPPKKSAPKQHKKNVRIGNGRISAGAAPKYFKRMPLKQQLRNPVSIPISRSWAGVTLNWSLWWRKTPIQIRFW